VPLNKTLLDELQKRYGREKGEHIYWGMAGEGTGPFGPKGKYRAEHEQLAAKGGSAPLPGKKKGRQSGKGTRRRPSRMRGRT
jgi:hypothetical protein